MNSSRTLLLIALCLLGGLLVLALGPRACSGRTSRGPVDRVLPLGPPVAPKTVFDPREAVEITTPSENEGDGEWEVATLDLAPEALADEGTASVLVTIRDQNGRPLPRAVVGMTGPGGQSVFGIREKSRGAKRFEKLTPGPWTLLAYADAKRRVRQEIELRSSDVNRPIAIVLQDADLIDVEFRGVDGRPLADVLRDTPNPPFQEEELFVIATRQRPEPLLPGLDEGKRLQYGLGQWHSRKRLQYGSPTISLPAADTSAGVLELRAEGPVQVSVCLRELVLETIALPEGASFASLVVSLEELQDRLASVSIRVLDDFTGQAPEGVTVLFEPASTQELQLDEKPAIGTDGRIEWTGVSPGWYILRAYGTNTEIVQRAVRVEPGVRMDLGELRLSSPFEVTGVVKSSTGERLRSIFLIRETDWEAEDIPIAGMPLGGSGNDGKVRLARLGKARYDILVRAAGHAPKAITLDTRQGQPEPVQVTLQPGAPVVLSSAWPDDITHRVSVLDPRDRALFVELLPGQRKRRLSLAPGNYTVLCSHGSRTLARRSITVEASGLALEVSGPQEAND